jgi:hypothetical protein
MAFMFELIVPRGLYASAADVHPINLKQLCHRSALIVTEQSLTYLVPSHIAYVKLVSVNEDEGDVPVCIQYLYPRVFNFVHGLGWDFVVPGDGEL